MHSHARSDNKWITRNDGAGSFLNNRDFVTAGDLGSAVDRLKEVTPDLLITRTYVEGMTGHDAAAYLRTKSNGLRVLMVGGLLDDQRLKNRESLEGFDVFPKPYSPRELLQKVKDVLAKPRGDNKGSP